MRSNGVTRLCYVQIYMEGSNTTTVNIDSYSVYNIWKDISDEERVNADFEALTKDSILSKPEAGGMTDPILFFRQTEHSAASLHGHHRIPPLSGQTEKFTARMMM